MSPTPDPVAKINTPPYQVCLVTIFPELFDAFFTTSLLGRAIEADLVREIRLNPREHVHDVHRTVDDAPFGGGAGMIMKPEPLAATLRDARTRVPAGSPCILLSPQGAPFSQSRAQALAGSHGMVLLCGRYEGVDDRVRQHLVDEEISIGDYVLSGGEVAAMAVLEAVIRLVPGVLGNAESPREESFVTGRLEYPQFTRPASWEGHEVPEILRSGDHERIREWRLSQALWRTRQVRPDLFALRPPNPEEARLMERYPPVWDLHLRETPEGS
ncbi:MAG: tRNA (guanosine(37)-N1)-methyltransferase TrmD [Polyangia bacterium]|jgi:tRNA (guanine37-N1)-methyltransferase|nr:tRNA (guanosine(37)-N1)-methyltransferase TrmD [Polyangia bacterium]